VSVTEWILVGFVVFLVIDAIVYVRWIRRAKAAREAGKPPPPLRWL
jgi:large-conductance mechanosensitive channel